MIIDADDAVILFWYQCEFIPLPTSHTCNVFFINFRFYFGQ